MLKAGTQEPDREVLQRYMKETQDQHHYKKEVPFVANPANEEFDLVIEMFNKVKIK